MEGSPQIKEKEYLNPGIHAIMVGLGVGEIKESPEALTINEDGIEYVNIDADPSIPLEDGFSGEYVKPHWAYVMSPVDSAAKFSTRYIDCTGVVVVGKDKKTGKNISFLTHQNPSYFTYEPGNFLKDLRGRLVQLREKSELGTIDAVLFGGVFSNVKELKHLPDHPIHNFNKDQYFKSIKLVAGEIESEMGFSPSVISGPKINPAIEHVVFDTFERRLFLERVGSGEPNFVRSFDSNDVDSVARNLPIGEWPLPQEVKDKLKEKLKGSSSVE